MPKVKQPLIISDLYFELNNTKKLQLREMYMTAFDLSLQQFYKDINNSAKLGPERMLFFARAFGLRMEELFSRLPEGPDPIVHIRTEEVAA